MWYKKVGTSFFRFVIIQAFDRQTRHWQYHTCVALHAVAQWKVFMIMIIGNLLSDDFWAKGPRPHQSFAHLTPNHITSLPSTPISSSLCGRYKVIGGVLHATPLPDLQHPIVWPVTDTDILSFASLSSLAEHTALRYNHACWWPSCLPSS